MIAHSSGPQASWHQGPVSQKTIFPQIWGGGTGFRTIQAHYICGDLGYCDISSTSDHEALDPGGGSPLTGDSGSAVDEIWLGHDQHGAVCGSEATA